MAQLTITSMRHPSYNGCLQDWTKWRLAYEGGRNFINRYLKKYSKREDTAEFEARRDMTYCPRFAGAAVDDVRNSIYHRMSDIHRIDGDRSYQQAITGVDGGVNLDGASMNMFIGGEVLPELLVMSKVGVYVDMPSEVGTTLADIQNKRPYLYFYSAEDIQSWSGCYHDNTYRFTSLLLRNEDVRYDDETGLANGKQKTWSLFKLLENGVKYTLYDAENNVIETKILEGMRRIPFVIMELKKSLMEDICDYQIALLNMESSDVNYSIKSNFPIFTQPYDPRSESGFIRPSAEQQDTDALRRQEKSVGPLSGLKYPIGGDRPDFIFPSPEPLRASMAKEEQIKNDIRKLLNLSLGAIEPKFASAESKGMDDRSLESGLSAIGQILQHGEQQIAEIWAAYLNTTTATVTYPRNYALKSEADRREEAKVDAELLPSVPSRTFQKEMAKKIARNLVGQTVSPTKLVTIEEEIEAAKWITSDPNAIQIDLENGLVSDSTASEARGYDSSEVPQAKLDRAERIKLTQMAQTSPEHLKNAENLAARGLKDLDPEHGNKSARDEKKE